TMAFTNDDWMNCPICLEEWNDSHRPITFQCGHTVCIWHKTGIISLRQCPLCRHPLSRETWCVSYNLEQAAHTFRMIRQLQDVKSGNKESLMLSKPRRKYLIEHVAYSKQSQQIDYNR
ncbi:unnamed protein product, partial [Didymodactylos carnosus]